MKKIVQSLMSNLLYLVPEESRYEICRHHTNKHFAENRSDFHSNGELWLLKNVMPSLRTVFDVGAFRGEWSAEALRLNSHIRLHSFEPSQRSFAELKRNVAGEGVTCNNFGLGSRDSRATLYGFEQLGEGDSLYLRKGLENIKGYTPQNTREEVAIRTLDGYCKEKGIAKIDLIKIDVEGHELAVLQGAKSLFARQAIEMVQFEYGGCYVDSRTLLRDIYEFLEGTNYTFFLLYPRRLSAVAHYDQRLENFQYKNFLIANDRVVRSATYFQQLIS
jgi:FkbM family methyltransferase